ncbi:hypothetical protein [Roseovarius lutimaris]|uniref:hypothetical protein n=1 Tax=Roseovarius lutimaris TaxID=1005928 RepID=UPI0015A70774|nr:hypothetical protein [Roseovarius lutimaris]
MQRSTKQKDRTFWTEFLHLRVERGQIDPNAAFAALQQLPQRASRNRITRPACGSWQGGGTLRIAVYDRIESCLLLARIDASNAFLNIAETLGLKCLSN